MLTWIIISYANRLPKILDPENGHQEKLPCVRPHLHLYLVIASPSMKFAMLAREVEMSGSGGYTYIHLTYQM
jgi:hypothetical protein